MEGVKHNNTQLVLLDGVNSVGKYSITSVFYKCAKQLQGNEWRLHVIIDAKPDHCALMAGNPKHTRFLLSTKVVSENIERLTLKGPKCNRKKRDRSTEPTKQRL